MREFVGNCHSCHVEVYCENGFFGGVIDDTGKVYCFSCIKEAEAKDKGEKR